MGVCFEESDIVFIVIAEAGNERGSHHQLRSFAPRWTVSILGYYGEEAVQEAGGVRKVLEKRSMLRRRRSCRKGGYQSQSLYPHRTRGSSD